MNRRDFLKRLGLATTAVALSPLLDLAPIVESPSVIAAALPFWSSHVPASTGVLTLEMMQRAIDRICESAGNDFPIVVSPSVERAMRRLSW